MTATEAGDAFSALASNPAVVTIDMHRGHLDPTVATLPLPSDAASALVGRVVPILDDYRDLGIRVLHVVTSYRSRGEILSNPFWRFQSERPGSTRRAIAEHNLEWLPGLELMPGIKRAGDMVIQTKKRYDCFVGTDLEFVLRSGNHDSVVLLGVNTNSCVLATTIAASVRDFAAFVVSEGVDTMLGPTLHVAAEEVIGASFGWVIDAATTLDVLRGRARVAQPVGSGVTNVEERFIEEVTTERGPHYEPFGWHHWPEHPWLSYQFRRQLGETQEGGGAVSECFQAASRMVPGDLESWYQEWLRLADRNDRAGDDAERAGHVLTAKAAWLRATDYFRSAEFWLAATDPRRLATFDRCERAFQKAGLYFNPPMERVEIPYQDGQVLYGYFVRAPYRVARQPVLIAFGGLDSFKEELLFMVGRGALERGIACLLVDGPGQGGTLRRERIVTRFDYEVPVGKCIDYLEQRDDVDAGRVAVAGSSLGGYYAARAGCFEHRLSAVVSHGAIWSVNDLWRGQGEDFGLADHIKWVFGQASMADALEAGKAFTLDGILANMRCPYLIVHGGHDVLGVRQATRVYEAARAAGVNVMLELVPEEATGSEHCQHDNPGIAQNLIGDWLADRFGIDQRVLVRQAH